MAEETQSNGPSKNELAEARTDWAYSRTLLAAERTYSAWMRTGLAASAAGLAVARLLASQEPRWLIRALGVGLLAFGAVVFIIGAWSYRKILKQLEADGVRGLSVQIVWALTVVLLAGAGIGILIIAIE